MRRRISWRPVGGCLAQALDGLLEVVGAALGQGQRRVGHPAELHALLRAGRGDRLLEVGARGGRVVALRGSRPEDRLGGGPELLLAQQLLVATLLERLHGGELAGLGHPDLSLLGRHREASLGLARLPSVPRSLLAVLVALAALALPPRRSPRERPGVQARPRPEETTPAAGHHRLDRDGS